VIEGGGRDLHVAVSPSLRALLQNAIDYAGLFPPTSLDMATAVANYRDYLAGDDRWALGRFIVPASRLDEFGREAGPALATALHPWRLSALIGADAGKDLGRVQTFNDRAAPPNDARHPRIDAIELRAPSVSAIEALPPALGDQFETYVEIPLASDMRPLIRAIGRARLRAKVRTGGITADAIPAVHDVLRFLRACVEEHVPFKATAGLHHPLWASYRLTYEPDSPSASMFGFLNVFLTAAFLVSGGTDADAIELLTEGDAGSIHVEDDGVRWRDRALTRAHLEAARLLAIASFGSCSFREPIEELRALHLEPSTPDSRLPTPDPRRA
jgi:hypothetical protein